jgi:hypothetical protein
MSLTLTLPLLLALACAHRGPVVEGAGSPALPPLVSLDNRCRPGDCLGWDWEVEVVGSVGLGVQILDWVEPEERNRVRLQAMPRALSPEEAIAWLERERGALRERMIWRDLELLYELDDGFTLAGKLGDPDQDHDFGWGGHHVVTFRIFEGVQVACIADHWRTHDALDEDEWFCRHGFASGDQPPDRGITTHSWMSLRAGWELPRREHLAVHATYLGGQAEGHERTEVQLRDPMEPVEVGHWLRGLTEQAGFLNSGFIWSEAGLTRELDGGFLIEGVEQLVGTEEREPVFMVIRTSGGHPVLCHPITIEQAEHYAVALDFCLEGFAAMRD